MVLIIMKDSCSAGTRYNRAPAYVKDIHELKWNGFIKLIPEDNEYFITVCGS